MPFISANDNTKIHYQIDISKNIRNSHPLFLIAGITNSLNAFDNIIPLLTKKYTVIRMDNRGAGKTCCSDNKHNFTLDDIAQDAATVINHLKDELNFNKIDVIGHSMGGAIAQILAINNPKLINKLVLSSTFCVSDKIPLTSFELMAQMQENNVDIEIITKLKLIMAFSEDFIKKPQNISDLVEFAKNSPPVQTHAGFVKQINAYAKFDASDPKLLNKITCPTLIISSENDLIAPKSNALYLKEHIPNSILHIEPNQAHCWYMENPDDFVNLIFSKLI